MVAGYLMWKENICASKAIYLIKSKRNCADINLGFNIQLHKWENYLFSSPKKIQLFKLTPNIRLMDEEEKEIDIKENYLIKIKYKLYYINSIFNNENEIINNKNEQNKNKNIIFNIYKDHKKEFIKNVIKYDKGLLKNDFSSFVEIR